MNNIRVLQKVQANSGIKKKKIQEILEMYI